MSPTKEAIHTIINEAWNKADLSVLHELVDPSYRRHIPAKQVEGIDGFKRHIQTAHNTFSLFHTTIDDIVEEGSQGVILWTTKATHRQSGKSLDWSGMTWYRYDGEKLVEEWELYDQKALAEKLSS